MTGLLVFYDEDPDWLYAAVSSFAPVLDCLVAIDGPYELYPERSDSSSFEHASLSEACREHDISLVLVDSREAWPDESMKRNASLIVAREVAGAEWVVSFDADCVAIQIDPEAVEQFLSMTNYDVAKYRVVDPGGVIPVDLLSGMQKPDDHRFVYRMTASLQYGRVLWHVNNSGGVLWGPGQGECLDLGGHFVVEHRSSLRPPERRHRAIRYYEERNRRGSG